MVAKLLANEDYIAIQLPCAMIKSKAKPSPFYSMIIGLFYILDVALMARLKMGFRMPTMIK